MSNLSKDLLREYIKEQKFTSSDDILKALKQLFSDVLQEALEAELDESLGYGKYESSENKGNNSRNGHSKKKMMNNCRTLLFFFLLPPSIGSLLRALSSKIDTWYL